MDRRLVQNTAIAAFLSVALTQAAFAGRPPVQQRTTVPPSANAPARAPTPLQRAQAHHIAAVRQELGTNLRRLQQIAQAERAAVARVESTARGRQVGWSRGVDALQAYLADPSPANNAKREAASNAFDRLNAAHNTARDDLQIIQTSYSQMKARIAETTSTLNARESAPSRVAVAARPLLRRQAYISIKPQAAAVAPSAAQVLRMPTPPSYPLPLPPSASRTDVPGGHYVSARTFKRASVQLSVLTPDDQLGPNSNRESTGPSGNAADRVAAGPRFNPVMAPPTQNGAANP